MLFAQSACVYGVLYRANKFKVQNWCSKWLCDWVTLPPELYLSPKRGMSAEVGVFKSCLYESGVTTDAMCTCSDSTCQAGPAYVYATRTHSVACACYSEYLLYKAYILPRCDTQTIRILDLWWNSCHSRLNQYRSVYFIWHHTRLKRAQPPLLTG